MRPLQQERAFSRWSRLVLSPFFVPVVLVVTFALVFGASRLLAGSYATC